MNIIKKIYPILVSVVVLFFIVRAFNVQNIGATLHFLNYKIILVIFFAYCLIKLLNTFRYSSFYGFQAAPLVFMIMCFCNFILNILPFRIGEVSYLRYFKKYFNIDYSQGVSRLAVIRLSDYLTIIFLFLVSAVFVVPDLIKKLADFSGWIPGIFAVTSLVGIIIFVGYKILRTSHLAYVVKVREVFKNGLKELKIITKKSILLLAVLSMLYWLARVLQGYFVLRMLGINPGVSVIFFISMGSMALDILPIKTFAGFGIFEGGWVTLLALWGYKSSDIFEKILAFHLGLLSVIIGLGFISYIFLKLNQKRLQEVDVARAISF